MESWKFRLLLCAGLSALLSGCQQEEITNYKVEKVAKNVSANDTVGESHKQRLLGAILPHGEKTWFFKLMGPSPAVAEAKDAFDRFVQSVRFTDGGEKPLTWTVPEGWKQEPGKDLRYATFRFGPQDAPLELTVIPLGKDAGSIKDNVDRWRGQLGLKATTEAELKEVCKDTKLEAGPAMLVDMSGPGTGGKPTMPPFLAQAGAGRASDRPSGQPKLTYQTPNGWKERPNVMFSVATFQISDGGKTADISVSPLAGPAGGLKANVDRWRQQVGLPAVSQEQHDKDLKTVTIAGVPGQYVDLPGPSGQRILGAAVLHSGQTWFFKMKGPTELVDKHKAAFEAFMRSVKFDGGTGG